MKHLSQYILLISFFLLGSCKRDKTPQLSGEHDDTFTNYFKKTSGWVAGDGAYSIPMASGNSLWVFGDSHIDDYDNSTQTTPCLFQVRNAGLLMNVANPSATTTLTGTGSPPSYFALGTDNNYWFWPGCGFEYGDSVYVFLNRTHSTGSGSWAFEGVDTNIVACIPNNDLSKVSYSVLPSTHGIAFSSAIVKDASGYCYVYGTKTNGFGNDVFVAKFPAANIYAPWQYYNGSGWTSDINSIQKIHSEFTASFSVCKIKTKYVLITTEFSVDCDQGKNIFVASSDNPYGPFTGQHSVWEVDNKLQGHWPLFYLANAHPEFDNGNEQLLITYCINGFGNCVNTCVNGRMDPDTYRPKAIRVPYHSLDPAL